MAGSITLRGGVGGSRSATIIIESTTYREYETLNTLETLETRGRSTKQVRRRVVGRGFSSSTHCCVAQVLQVGVDPVPGAWARPLFYTIRDRAITSRRQNRARDQSRCHELPLP